MSGPSRNLLFAFTFALSVGTHAVHCQDWQQWRGPHRNGLVPRSPRLVNAFGGQSPLWRSDEVPSGERGGRGSVVVSNARIYGLTASQSSSDRRTEVFCLDEQNGETLWRAKLNEPAVKETASSTPCIVGDRLYVAGSTNKVHCLRISDGSPVWERALPRTSKKPVASSVSVVGTVVIVLADVLTGVDAATGDVLWTQDEIEGFESSPAVWQSASGARVLCNTARETHCIDPVDGRVMWKVPGGGKSTPVIAQEYGGDFLVNMAGSRQNGLSAYRLTDTAATRLWTVRAFDRAASPVVYDGHVYAIAGGRNGHGARILCVHLDTGQIAWDETISFAEVSSPVVADGKLVAVCGTQLWLVRATPQKFSVLSQTNCQITLCTSPALQDGRLYLRQSGAVVCYDLRSDP